MSKEIVKKYGKSIRSRLLNIAKSENIYYQTILTRYFQERLIYRMSQTFYRQNFYLKGGALMYAHEKFAARTTLDIDFLATTCAWRSCRPARFARPVRGNDRQTSRYKYPRIPYSSENDAATIKLSINCISNNFCGLLGYKPAEIS